MKRELSTTEFRQCLAAAQQLPRQGSDPLATIAEAGFARTLGGADVYLALRARTPDVTRADVDELVERRELKVVPAVRGCIYLAHRDQAALCLRTADLLSRSRRHREHQKVGLGQRELDRLGDDVLDLLTESGPLSTSGLRSSLPEGRLRSFGEAGKKVGISSPLPPALRQLEFAGAIERTPQGGRLDTERYLWRATDSNPLASTTDDPTELFRGLAAEYFRFSGLGTVDAFTAWAGLGKRDARAACEAVTEDLGLLPIEVPSLRIERLAVPRALDEVSKARRRPAGIACFLPFEDNLSHLQGGPHSLVEEAHHGLEVPKFGSGKPVTIATARHVASRVIVVDGEIVGFWELDPLRGRVVTGCFAKAAEPVAAAVSTGASELEEFLANEIGHARSSSLDTDKSMLKRCDQLRSLAA